MTALNRTYNKVAAVTLSFWIMKICATTLGETAGDLLSMTMDVGYAVSTLILLGIFLATLIAQLSARTFHPVLFWLVILSTSTAGTTLSDYMDRTLGLGYAAGAALLVTILIGVLIAWLAVQGSLSVERIQTRRAEIFYWMAILVSNTLGTALGDFLADSSGLGFLGGAAVISAALLAIAMAYFITRISRIALFWMAFVLTRPFGATFGDLLTKPTTNGGLGFGTIGSSAVLGVLLIALIIISYRKDRTTGGAHHI
jgi:uncharacterized membrane-anchored protein